jgi:hypothetical protein
LERGVEYTKSGETAQKSQTMTHHATRIVYVEIKKNGDNDRGRASIRRVRLSKSGRTIYIGGMGLKSCKGSGISGNYINPETGIEYWVSRPKKKGGDRHWAGGGPVYVEPDVQEEYWRNIRGLDQLPDDPFWT